jgi:hypothetical protein
MRTLITVFALMLLASCLVACSQTSGVRFRKAEDHGTNLTLLLENTTQRPLVIGWFGIVQPDALKQVLTNTFVPVAHVEAGSNQLFKVSGHVDANRRVAVLYRHEESATEERVRKAGAWAHLCSEYPSKKEIRCVSFP